MEDLPSDIIFSISGKLTNKDRISLKRTSKRLYGGVCSEFPNHTEWKPELETSSRIEVEHFVSTYDELLFATPGSRHMINELVKWLGYPFRETKSTIEVLSPRPLLIGVCGRDVYESLVPRIGQCIRCVVSMVEDAWPKIVADVKQSSWMAFGLGFKNVENYANDILYIITLKD